MTLKRLYIRGVIFPTLIVVVSISCLAVLDNNDYTSEWMTKESVIFMSILFSFIYSLIICTLSLTIFLNNKFIKTGSFASFLSWFLLPMGWIILAVSKSLYHRQKHYPNGNNMDLIYLVVVNLPFVI